MKKHILFLIILLGVFVTSCDNIPITQQEVSIPHEKWESSFSPFFSFNITDTTSYYNVFLYLRHRNVYAYNNIWLRVYGNIGEDSVYDAEKEFVLASAHRWLGKDITGDIIEHFIPITRTPIILPRRNINIRLEQIMQDDPLSHIMNVGIRIEKVKVVH